MPLTQAHHERAAAVRARTRHLRKFTSAELQLFARWRDWLVTTVKRIEEDHLHDAVASQHGTFFNYVTFYAPHKPDGWRETERAVQRFLSWLAQQEETEETVLVLQAFDPRI